eukprot:2895128-Rhodomonas_salina.1
MVRRHRNLIPSGVLQDARVLPAQAYTTPTSSTATTPSDGNRRWVSPTGLGLSPTKLEALRTAQEAVKGRNSLRISQPGENSTENCKSELQPPQNSHSVQRNIFSDSGEGGDAAAGDP